MFSFSDAVWRKGVQNKLFKVRTAVRILVAVSLQIAGFLGMTQDLFQKPNSSTLSLIDSDTREFKKTFNLVIDTAAVNVLFQLTGLQPNAQAKLLVLWETGNHTHH